MRAHHYDVADASEDAVRAAAGRLDRELREGAAVLAAAGDELWAQRLRDKLAEVADLAAAELDDLIDTIDGASKAMQAAGLHAEARKLVWSVVDVLVIRDNIHHGDPG